MTNRQQWTLITGLVTTAVFGVALAIKLRPQINPVEIGSGAPAFRATNLRTNQPATLADYRGKVVLVNIWATWCPPCRAEMPSMERLHQKLAGTDFRIAAVSVETFPTAGKAGQGLFLSVRHEDVRMFKQHIDVYRKAWTDAGHAGEAPVYLRCPGFVAKTDAAAQEAYGPTLMQHFQNQSRLLADSSRRQNSPPDHPRWKTSRRLTEITLEETLRGSVFIGSPDTVVGKLKDLQRDIGLSGVQLETNCAGLADHAAEREAIRLLAREVKSAFR